MSVEKIEKVINPCMVKCGNSFYQAFVKIKYDNGNLSITGVIGPIRGGDSHGSCGQIYDKLEGDIKLNKGWDRKNIGKLVSIWKEWHLNDVQPDCEHQRAEKWGDKLIPIEELSKGYYNTAVINGKEYVYSRWVYPGQHKDGVLNKPCPKCGYKYGSAWLRKEVPQDVLVWLDNLPNTERKPAWI